MKRREFLTSTAGVLGLLQTLKANQEEIKRNGKSAILLWMGGGPSTMDIWDLNLTHQLAARLDQLAQREMCRFANTCH